MPLPPVCSPNPHQAGKGHPGVPTMDEQGFAGFDATTWYGLVGPARMNPAMVKRMNEDMNPVKALPDERG